MELCDINWPFVMWEWVRRKNGMVAVKGISGIYGAG